MSSPIIQYLRTSANKQCDIFFLIDQRRERKRESTTCSYTPSNNKSLTNEGKADTDELFIN